MNSKRLTFDSASKAVLKEDNIRAGILKYLVDDYKDMSVNDVKKLISKVLPVTDETIPKSRITYDILFTAKLPNSDESIGIYIDIEPQGYKESDENLVNRSLYYCCRLLSRQRNLVNGGFSGNEYEKLKKVYSIWIITDERDRERRGIVTRIKLRENDCEEKIKIFDEKIYDKLEMIFLYPENTMEKSKKDILSFLSVLLSDDGTLQEKVNVLQSVYEIKVSDKERKAMNGFLNVNEDQIRKDIEVAELNGIQKGIQKGKMEEKVNSAVEHVKNVMDSLNMNTNEAMNLLKISDDIKAKVLEKLTETEVDK